VRYKTEELGVSAMKRVERVGLLCLLVTLQGLTFAYAWNILDQIERALWDTRMDYKALVYRTEGLIIDYGLDPPSAPIWILFALAISLTAILLVDAINNQTGRAKT